jgi:hypothetical protein
VKRAIALASILAILALAGCTGESSPVGLGEPLQVASAVFKAGSLPGSPPVDGGASSPPTVSDIQSLDNVMWPGEAGKTLNGYVTDTATAIDVRFTDIGTGYWLFVPGPPDPTTPGQLTWSASLDIAAAAPPGLHTLGFAAVDADGHSGSQTDLDTCITDPVPDNLNACAPTIAPPRAVLSLAWSDAADLDLALVTPSGQVIDPKHPTATPSADGGPSVDPESVGVLDHDSGANCVPGTQREDVVWQHAPVPGTYLVYVNMFAACGVSAAPFTVTLYTAEPLAGVDGGQTLAVSFELAGELLAMDQNGGASMGLFVKAFSLP